MKLRDLGLDYHSAAHGIQTAIAFEMRKEYPHLAEHLLNILKHFRVGIDCRASDAQGLAALLIAKGVFTTEEYLHYIRISANEELARYTEHLRSTYNLPDSVEFR